MVDDTSHLNLNSYLFLLAGSILRLLLLLKLVALPSTSCKGAATTETKKLIINRLNSNAWLASLIGSRSRLRARAQVEKKE